MNVKRPTTTRLPDWGRLVGELLARQDRLLCMAATLRTLGHSSGLETALEEIETRLRSIEQMRRVSERNRRSAAA